MFNLCISETAIDGAILRFYRERMRITQIDMAKHLGVSRAQYVRYEAGEQFLTIANLRRALRNVSVKLSDFCKLATFVYAQLSKNGISVVCPGTVIELGFTLSKQNLINIIALANKEMLSNE